MAVLFIDVPELVSILVGINYKFSERTDVELELNIIVRVAQSLCFLFSMCIGYMLYQ